MVIARDHGHTISGLLQSGKEPICEKKEENGREEVSEIVMTESNTQQLWYPEGVNRHVIITELRFEKS